MSNTSKTKNQNAGLKRFKEAGLNTVWNTNSTCVFESQKNRTVIGRYDGTQFVAFDEETRRLCKEFGHDYDPSLDEDDEDEEDETEENVGETNEEEEEIDATPPAKPELDSDSETETIQETPKETPKPVLPVVKKQSVSTESGELISMDDFVGHVNDLYSTISKLRQTIEEMDNMNKSLQVERNGLQTDKDELQAKCVKLKSAMKQLMDE